MPLCDRISMQKLFALSGRTAAVIYGDDELDEALSYALLLEEDEGRILSAGRYALPDILYGRYYWFTKFLIRYEDLYGKDAGMEQQQFKIFEAICGAECADHSLLEKIERDLKGGCE